MIHRRDFLTGVCASALLRGSLTYGQTAGSELVVRSGAPGRNVPESFTGLSYELAQLTEPSFFSAEHKDLIALFRRLSPAGVLRLGGNTSESCWFRDSETTQPPTLRVPASELSDNWMPHRMFEIRPEAIDSLASFLEATGWVAIYGMNFGNSTPERAQREAEYVARRLGSRLAYFQIGNEPDFYRDSNNGTRPADWGYRNYIEEWMRYADAISAKVPHAKFGGPDTGAASDWVVRFGEDMSLRLGDRLVALSGHYYAEGPPNDPRVTTQRLLTGDPKVTSSTKEIVRVADAHHLSYRMAEGNSCYRGGKPGMSDAFASSLWAADYLLTLAKLGCAGINLHGGDSRFLSAGLGDHNPGLQTAEGKGKAVANGFYTPIRSELGQVARATPVYHGMLLAQQFAGTTMLEMAGALEDLVTAFAARKNETQMVALFNKSSSIDRTITLTAEQKIRRARIWRLSAPSLASTEDVTFGGAPVGSDGSWHTIDERLRIVQGRASIDLPRASGALVFLG